LAEIKKFISKSRFHKNSHAVVQFVKENWNARIDFEKFSGFHTSLSNCLLDLQSGILAISSATQPISNEQISQAIENDRNTETKELAAAFGKQLGDALREWKSVVAITAPQLLEQDSEDIISEDKSSKGKKSEGKGSESKAAETPVSLHQKSKVFIRPVKEELLHFQESEVGLVGQGAFCKVYKGQYDGENCAIKRYVLTGSALPPAESDTLRKEALIMQAVDHENLLKFKCASMEKGLLVVELAHCSLSDAIHGSKGPPESITAEPSSWMSLSFALKVAHDAAKGLRYLHLMEVIHRDIKPSNGHWCRRGEVG
jgi:hypothetical protein